MYTSACNCVALVAALAAGPGVKTEMPTSAPYLEIDAYLEARLEANEVPGAAYAIVSPDSIEHLAVWGEDGDGEPVTESTPFLWGSVAKPVTATAVMTLVENGALELDEPVTEYLPEFALADESRSARITLRHLLEQTSGIPEGTGITDRYEEREDPYGEAVAGLAGTRPFAEPGETFEYASANYLVLGAVVEAVSGMPYERYLREAVLDPLQMDGAVATMEDAESLPGGHSYAFGRPVGVDARFDQTGPSYGYLGGSVTDLAHFAMSHLNGGAFGSEQVLRAESIAHMHTGAAEISDTISYGLGWRVDSRNDDLGTSTIWHTGGTPGYSAGMILLPELDRAVVVVQNAYGFFQDSALVRPMLGAARLLAGGDVAEPESDPTYPAVLGVLITLLVAAALIVAWSLRQIRRGAPAPKSRWRIGAGMSAWALAGLTVAYVAAVVLPAAAPSRSVLVLLAPDVGWSLFALAVAALVVVAVRLWWGALRLRAPQ